MVLQKYGNDEQETLPLDITDAEAVAEVKPPPFWHCVFPVLLVVLRDSSLSFRQLDAKVFGQAAASVDVVVNCAVTRYSPVMSKLRPSAPSCCNSHAKSFGKFWICALRPPTPLPLLPELERISALRSLFVFVRTRVHQKHLAAQPGR